MVHLQFTVDIVLPEETVFRVKDLIAQFGYKFFKKATSINTFFNLAVFIYKLYLELSLKINLVHINSVECVLKDVSSIDGDWVPAVLVFSLLFDEMLEDLCSKRKRNSMWHIDQNCMTYRICDLC